MQDISWEKHEFVDLIIFGFQFEMLQSTEQIQGNEVKKRTGNSDTKEEG